MTNVHHINLKSADRGSNGKGMIATQVKMNVQCFYNVEKVPTHCKEKGKLPDIKKHIKDMKREFTEE